MENSVCKKVISLLSLYIENKLDIEDRILIENHFEICPDCYNKYLEMKEVMSNLHFEYEKLINEFDKIENGKMFNIREYESFYNNISPYIDDELSYNDSIKFRRYLLKSKPARNELANAYNLKNNIKHSVAIFKNNTNINFSKKVIKKLKNENHDSFDKIYQRAAIMLGIMVSALLFITMVMGFSYISENSMQTQANNTQPFSEIPMSENDDELVEFTFDENHEALLTAK